MKDENQEANEPDIIRGFSFQKVMQALRQIPPEELERFVPVLEATIERLRAARRRAAGASATEADLTPAEQREICGEKAAQAGGEDAA
jgi:uncharacterized small protein (DUF1192 family)